MIWFLIFQKAELQHAFSTRINLPIWMNPNTSRQFLTLIPMQLTVLRNSIVLRYFSPAKFENNSADFTAHVIQRGLKISAQGLIFMLNHVIKKVYQNSKILQFLGVKSEIYQSGLFSGSIKVSSDCRFMASLMNRQGCNYVQNV